MGNLTFSGLVGEIVSVRGKTQSSSKPAGLKSRRWFAVWLTGDVLLYRLFDFIVTIYHSRPHANQPHPAGCRVSKNRAPDLTEGDGILKSFLISHYRVPGPSQTQNANPFQVAAFGRLAVG